MDNRKRLARNDFSLKKAVKKVGSVVKDAGKLAIQPAATAVSSVTGKKIKITYDTKVGKVASAVNKTLDKTANIAAKSFADTITGGLATKAANVLRKDENKEKPYQYFESKKSDTGIKAIDKTADVLAKAAPILGAVAGAGAAASGINKIAKKLKLPPNVVGQLAQKANIGSADTSPFTSQDYLNDMVNGQEYPPIDVDNGQKTAGFDIGGISPIMIGIAIVLLVIAVSASKKSSGSKTIRRK